jgi:hypothetical protein
MKEFALLPANQEVEGTTITEFIIVCGAIVAAEFTIFLAARAWKRVGIAMTGGSETKH